MQDQTPNFANCHHDEREQGNKSASTTPSVSHAAQTIQLKRICQQRTAPGYTAKAATSHNFQKRPTSSWEMCEAYQKQNTGAWSRCRTCSVLRVKAGTDWGNNERDPKVVAQVPRHLQLRVIWHVSPPREALREKRWNRLRPLQIPQQRKATGGPPNGNPISSAIACTLLLSAESSCVTLLITLESTKQCTLILPGNCGCLQQTTMDDANKNVVLEPGPTPCTITQHVDVAHRSRVALHNFVVASASWSRSSSRDAYLQLTASSSDPRSAWTTQPLPFPTQCWRRGQCDRFRARTLEGCRNLTRDWRVQTDVQAARLNM